MRGVSFDAAKVALPAYCMQLMQNVGMTERLELERTVTQLAAASMPDQLKAYNLGLLLMNVVGGVVLEQAVRALGRQIIVPPSLPRQALDQATSVTFDEMSRLVRLCHELDPLKGDGTKLAQAIEAFSADVRTATDTLADDHKKNLVLLIKLHERFGELTLMAAAHLITLRSAQIRTTIAPITLGDLQPQPVQATATSTPDDEETGEPIGGDAAASPPANDDAGGLKVEA